LSFRKVKIAKNKVLFKIKIVAAKATKKQKDFAFLSGKTRTIQRSAGKKKIELRCELILKKKSIPKNTPFLTVGLLENLKAE
jgi:hypothetical protein